MSITKEFTKGIIKENPVLILLLGMCPTLAVTTSAVNGLAMGLAVTAVLLGSNMVISILRNIIPAKVRIPVFIVIIATFVTIIDFAIHSFSYQLYKSLGIFIPLIVVNCIILGRAEAFASKHSVLKSLADGLGMGLGVVLTLTLLGSIREILGTGSVFGVNILGLSYAENPFLLMILPPGAFIALGLMLGLMNRVMKKET
ncbi:MAG: electron transport complex subunit E [Proteobacteria bacterium]|nr:electron transport complex subunit E [Pseudomonadota bacterium]